MSLLVWKIHALPFQTTMSIWKKTSIQLRLLCSLEGFAAWEALQPRRLCSLEGFAAWEALQLGRLPSINESEKTLQSGKSLRSEKIFQFHTAVLYEIS